ncbi:MAG: hypothetical protein IKC94_05455, partial [Lentisphaeria bacterium]|nr:hypothetical protein [Lentisphaeria bacterium]
MATLLIDKTMDATLTITKTDLYDILILPEAEGISTKGQVISVSGSSNNAGFDPDLEGFCVSLGKSDGKLMIGGNYGDNSFEVVGRASSEWFIDHWRSDFVATLTGLEALPGYFDTRYNLYHTGINDNFVTGTMNFNGANGQLVLAAQLGSNKADSYHTAVT